MNRRWTGTRSATDIAFWQNGLAALALLPFAWAAPAAIGSIGAREIMLLIVLGLACTALAHTLFIGGLAVVTAHTASVIAALEPVYGIALAFVAAGRSSRLANRRRRGVDRRRRGDRDAPLAPRHRRRPRTESLTRPCSEVFPLGRIGLSPSERGART